MDHAGMGFVEAVGIWPSRPACGAAGRPVTPGSRARRSPAAENRPPLTDVLEKAGEAWHQHLRDSPRAIQYFKGRGVSGQIASRYGLGYAPEGWRGSGQRVPGIRQPVASKNRPGDRECRGRQTLLTAFATG